MSEYSYKASDESFLTPFLYKFFVDPLVRVLSPRIPANFITLTAFSFILASFGIAVHGWLTHTYTGWWLIPIFVFIYLIGDCSDGKQARKTGTGSPLGEYFDHFLDSFVTGLLMGVFLISLQMKNPVLIAIGFFMLYFGQIATFWERYVSRVMHFNRISTSEGLIGFGIISWLSSFEAIRATVLQPVLWGMNYAEIVFCFLMFSGFIFTGIATLIRTGGCSFRLMLHFVLSLGVSCVSAWMYDEHIVYLTLLLTGYNALFLASLLAATALKTKTAFPDIGIPVSFAVLFFFPQYRILIWAAQLVYLCIRIIIRFAAFFKLHKQYWYWVNPVLPKV